MTLNNLLWLFIKPSHVVFLITIVGVLLWPTRFGRRCRHTACVLIVLLALLPVGHWLIRPLEQAYDIPATLDAVDGIIVLAGSERVGLSEYYGQPQLSAAGDRLTTFLLLAEQYPMARLAHSGRRDETAIASRIVLGTGVDSMRVTFDSRSRNTCDSARQLYNVLAPRPDEHWVLVTTASHMPRSVACFQAVDWPITAYPTDFRSGPSWFHFGLVSSLETLDIAAHEWVGLLYYRLSGRTLTFFPER